jgi:iron complex transport system permease protein
VSTEVVERVRPRIGSPTRLTNVWFVVSVTALVGAVLLGTLVGAVRIPAAGVIGEFLDPLPFVSFEGLSQGHAAILWQIRLPRVVLGGLVGAMLSASGAAYQGAFRNPLADPYLLGAAAGAGLGATLAIVYGPDTTSWPIDVLPLAAFVGAVGGVMIAYSVGRAAGTARSAGALILAGVAVASFLTALQTYFQQQNAETLREVYGWILGRLGTAGWDEVLLMLPYAAVSGAALLAHRRLLDVMAMGDEGAEAVGVDARRIRLSVVIVASLGTAAAVAVSGLIAFVGIIVPHTVRMLAGSSYRRVLPLSFLLGGAFLILADLVGRTIVAPAELPIGVITAFLGAPFFALVLRTSRRVP